MADNNSNRVLWAVAIGDRHADAVKLAKKTVDTVMSIEYVNPARLGTESEMKAAGMQACTELRDKLAALQANSKVPLVVHLHFCGPYTMALYLGMLVFYYQIPVVSISTYDRQLKDAIVVAVGGETDDAAEEASDVEAVSAAGDKTW